MHLGAPFTILLATLALGGAAALHLNAAPERERAAGLLEDAQKDAAAYVATFQGAHIDAQLTHFKARRVAHASAARFLLARDLCVLLAGVLVAVAWVQAFLRHLESLRVDGEQPSARASGTRPVPQVG